MKKHTKRTYNYPDQTPGSRMAARVRKEANRLNESARDALFKQGMQIIYGASAVKKAVRAGR